MFMKSLVGIAGSWRERFVEVLRRVRVVAEGDRLVVEPLEKGGVKSGG
jgi:hypothetical protein